MTIHDEYLFYQEKYEKKYGKEKTIVLMQIGSFHEAYATERRGHNLTEISDLLNVVLTRKDKKIEKISEKNPFMLGFPTVSLPKYLRVLINHGYTVIVIDQVTPPPDPKREITGIYSPGTYIEESFSPDANNIVCLYIEDEYQQNGKTLMCIGMSVVDLSTGEICINESYAFNEDEKYALDEALRFITTYNPKEIIIHRIVPDTRLKVSIMDKNSIIMYLELESKKFHYSEKIDKNFRKISYINTFLSKIYQDTGMLSPIEYLDMERKGYATISLVALLDFAYQHNENIINNLYKPEIYQFQKHLILGNNATYQLNVFENNTLETKDQKFKSLFDVVNNTSTAMGRRYLKNVLNNPLLSTKKLQDIYDCTEEMLEGDYFKLLESHFKCIIDLERMNRKLSLCVLHPFELSNLLKSYEEIFPVIDIIENTKYLKKILPNKKVIKDLKDFLKNSKDTFNDIQLKNYCINEIKNSIFEYGVHKDLDKYQRKVTIAEDFMNNICIVLSAYIDDVGKAKKSENDKDDLKIKIKNNNRDGHYLILTQLRAKSLKKNLKNVKKIKISDNLELETSKLRFKDLKKDTQIFIDELSNQSNDLVLLRDKIMGLSKMYLIQYYKENYEKYKIMFKKICKFISIVDFIKSSAKTAKLYNYKKPYIITDNGEPLDNGCVRCKNLRHPIIERIKTDCEYIPHNISLGKDENYCEGDDVLEGMLVFGINSCGKSSLMKAIGLSIIMAQSGMYVPASEYKFSPYDTLFARITGNDNIFKGLSSFVLEMTELRAILKRTGPKTLVIGDEVCRGTEHISGNSIVAATLINLAKTGSTFIFATHLHEIPNMDRIKELKNIKAFHLTVDYDKEKDMLIFDRKIKEGPGEPIYGVTVAKYVIQDDEFIRLAQEIKNELLEIPNKLLNDKTSKYNSNVYMYECGVCNKTFKDNKDHMGFFDTHHINHQKNCKDGFVIDKPHLPINSKANLIVLCKDCHHKTHNSSLEINGYIETSKGRKLDFKNKKYKDKMIELSSDDTIEVDEYIEILPKKSKLNNKLKRKYGDKDIKKILKLKEQKLSQSKAKIVLKNIHNMNISTRTISQIWNGTYI